MSRFFVKIDIIRKRFNRRATLSKIIVVLVIICGLLYLVEINNTSVKGYEINDLEQKAKKLEEQNKNIEMKVAQLQSIKVVQDKARELGMVSVGKVGYVVSSSSEMVVR